MPRYVLLRHELPLDADRAPHWDFMLEHEGVLWTWALWKLPAKWRAQLGLALEGASDEIVAARLVDHRRAYLTYEGPVSEGRGTVKRVAEGEYDLLKGGESPIEVELRGTLSGKVALTQRSESGSYSVVSASTD